MTFPHDAERGRLVFVVDALHDAEAAVTSAQEGLRAVAEPGDSITDIIFHCSSLISRIGMDLADQEKAS